MIAQPRRRLAALLEVCGIYLTGVLVENQIERVLVHWRLISTANPFDLLTAHASNADLLLASRQLFLALILQYGSYFLLIIPINWWLPAARPRGVRTHSRRSALDSADPRRARNGGADAMACSASQPG